MDQEWELLARGHYEDAINAYSSAMRTTTRAIGPMMANQGSAFLCLGRFAEAFERFEAAENEQPGRTDGYRNDMGGALWLLRRPQEAIATWLKVVEDIRAKRIQYLDAAGGVHPGLLLWFAAVSTRQKDLREFAIGFLLERAEEHQISQEPGPLALFVLKKIEWEHLLHTLIGVSSLRAAMQIARSSPLERRFLVRCLFYRGVASRDGGREADFLNSMEEVIQLQNPIIELEWYLARDIVRAGI